MRVIVTGSSGFLGSAVKQRLARGGHKVFGISRRSVTGSETVDLTDRRQVDSIDWPADAIVHLAADIPGSFGGESDRRAGEVNREIDLNVIAFAAARQVPVVFASTSSVYGAVNPEQISEETPIRPRGAYAGEKAWAEQNGRDRLGASGTPFAALRVNAPYGPDQPAKTVLHIFLRRLLQREPLQVFDGGLREQDFTFVDDVAAAFEAAARVRANGIFNISGGRPISMRDLAQLIIALFPAYEGRMESVKRNDPEQAFSARFDCRRAAAELGWTPRTRLEDGLSVCVRKMEQSAC